MIVNVLLAMYNNGVLLVIMGDSIFDTLNQNNIDNKLVAYIASAGALK